MTETPVIRTKDRDAVVRFLEYLVEGFRSGKISSYSSVFEISGIGRHCVTTNDPSAMPFDLSDLDPDATPPTAPGKRGR